MTHDLYLLDTDQVQQPTLLPFYPYHRNLDWHLKLEMSFDFLDLIVVTARNHYFEPLILHFHPNRFCYLVVDEQVKRKMEKLVYTLNENKFKIQKNLLHHLFSCRCNVSLPFNTIRVFNYRMKRKSDTTPNSFRCISSFFKGTKCNKRP
jgi:hypothetical protein